MRKKRPNVKCFTDVEFLAVVYLGKHHVIYSYIHCEAIFRCRIGKKMSGHKLTLFL